jgi:hypothetical protein
VPAAIRSVLDAMAQGAGHESRITALEALFAAKEVEGDAG